MQKLIRPSEAAKILGMSTSTIYRWFWEGKLRGVKLAGGPIRVFQDSVYEQIEFSDEENLPPGRGGDNLLPFPTHRPKDDSRWSA